MDSDITDYLTLEIKRELADRYFSFRKMIEEDNASLDEDIASSVSIEQKIVIDLSRLYIILQDEELISEFVTISGLQQDFFFDEYLLGSATIKARLFKDIDVWGLTWGGRFKKLLLECYEELVRHVEQYRAKYNQLADNEAMLKETIDLFYRQNDISSIMGFLRGMDSMGGMGGGLQGSINSGFDQSMEQKMHIKHPTPLELRLPMLPPLVPVDQINSELKKLASKALEYHPDDFLN